MPHQSDQTATIEAPIQSQTKQPVECPSCNQMVPRTEMVTAEVGEMDREVCQFCAASLFDDTDPAAFAASERDTTRESEPETPLSWTPPRPRSTTGLTGRMLQIHYLSLSVLWAIHRTNVRIFERILDEINVQQVAILAIMMIGMIGLAGIVSP